MAVGLPTKVMIKVTMSEEYIAGLSDNDLLDKLLAHVAAVGPVTGTSRRVLEKELARLMAGPNAIQTTTPRKPMTKSPARSVVSKPSPPTTTTAPRPVENNFSSSISQSRVSDAFSSSRGSLGSSAHASSRGSVGSSAPQSSLRGSVGSSSYDTRKSAYPSLDSTSADRVAPVANWHGAGKTRGQLHAIKDVVAHNDCKKTTSSPDPVAINQLRDDLFPVYRRTKYEEKLWNECETVLLQKDSRIRCDLHRTKDGDTVTAFRWIGTKY
uniref:LEM domain-containing protein n=1 Tax=Panagrellus redivivus TaxID=6233 RepID=A0A7E4W1P7_PANRE